MKFTYILIPLVILLAFLSASFRKADILKEFTEGAGVGLKTAVNIAPTLILLMTAVSMLKASGALSLITELVSPLAKLLNIPSELIPFNILKLFSGSGSVALLEDIFKTYGADSFIGRVASVTAASTETVFYTISLYYGAVNITKTRHSVLCALIASIVGFVVSPILVAFFF